MKRAHMSVNNSSVRNQHHRPSFVYVVFNNSVKFFVNIITGMDNIKTYLIRIYTKPKLAEKMLVALFYLYH